jgi:hypothetical protein
MSRSPRSGPQRPRVPTWALVLLVLAALGGAAWLFVADAVDPGSGGDSGAETSTVDESDDVLSLPNDDEPTDGRRRGEEGRDRLDDEDERGSGEGDAGDLDPDLPSAYASLRDRSVAVTVASAAGSGNADRLVRIGALRVPCAGLADAEALAAEQGVAAAAHDLLGRSGAELAGDPEADAATCTNARAKVVDGAEFAVVLRVDPKARAPRVFAGRPTAAADEDTVILAAELAATLGVDEVTPTTSRAARTLVTNAGAIDSPGGARVVLVELPASRVVNEAARQAVARDLADAIAAVAARADQAPTTAGVTADPVDEPAAG